MLKIVDQTDCQKMYIEFGKYLPFKFWCDALGAQSHLYWQVGNFDTSLIEFKIEPLSGQLIEVALILPGYINYGFFPISFKELEAKNGFPIIDIEQWPSNRFKELKKEFKIFINSNELLILLDEKTPASHLLNSENVSFGISVNNELVWISISELPLESLALLGSSCSM
jgi:hypothetical protein